MAKKSSKKPSADIARRIWLAGIGAYGSAFNEAQESLSKVSNTTSRKFDELVSKGEIIEKAVEVKGQEAFKKATSVPTVNIDDRLKQMRSRLGMQAGGASDLQAIEERLSAIEAKLDQLITKGTRSSTARKSVKTSTQKSKKAVKKKVAAKKTRKKAK
ncbi:MAG: hypothetical protein ACWA5L_04095 [bacterium]